MPYIPVAERPAVTRRRMSEALLMALLAVWLLVVAGCATIDIDRAPPADWPVLQIITEHRSQEEVTRACRSPAVGCALPLFAIGVCLVLLALPDAWLREHEELHCAGYDHPGSSLMRDAWKEHKRWMQRQLPQ